LIAVVKWEIVEQFVDQASSFLFFFAANQVTAAAKAIGNVDLETKFAKGIELLRRDIVFASSLYL
jgi:hypothetical protein